MKIWELLFSPTGGTEKVADIIAAAFSCETVKTDMTAQDFDGSSIGIDADVCFIAMPVIGGRAPSAAIKRLSAMNGCGKKAVLIAVYGNRAFEDALVEMQDAAANAGFTVCAAVAALAEHSILRKFAAGRPDAEDAVQLTDFAAKIAAAIENPNPRPVIPGNRPYKDFKGSSAKPVSTQSCIKCGLCAAKCPVSAISAEKPNETDLGKCISCMRCIYLCPNGGRKVADEVLANVDALLTRVASERRENELFI